MAFTTYVTSTVTQGTFTITNTDAYTTDQVSKVQETVPTGTTNAELSFTIDISKLKAFSMQASQVMTVKTNSSGTPQETFALTAGTPIVFVEGGAAIFSGDVTSLFVTNASGSAGTLSILSATEN
tara:strand:- start:1957 stop:2331 length:375 start_codon:yes stop_codon:yes gene_type:complete